MTAVSPRAEQVSIETAGARLQVNPGDLEFLERPEIRQDGRNGPATSRASAPASSWQGPEAEPEPEVDVRGLRVHDVGIRVDRALDQAVLGGLGELRIIHGKGTGALREAISELLKLDGRVSEFRMGGPSEGGAGVTVVRLR